MRGEWTRWAHPHRPQHTLATVPALRCSCLWGSRLAQQLGRGGSLWCVCGRGVEQGAGKDPGLRSYFKATESNGTEAWSMMTKEDMT